MTRGRAPVRGHITIINTDVSYVYGWALFVDRETQDTSFSTKKRKSSEIQGREREGLITILFLDIGVTESETKSRRAGNILLCVLNTLYNFYVV